MLYRSWMKGDDETDILRLDAENANNLGEENRRKISRKVTRCGYLSIKRFPLIYGNCERLEAETMFLREL